MGVCHPFAGGCLVLAGSFLWKGLSFCWLAGSVHPQGLDRALPPRAPEPWHSLPARALGASPSGTTQGLNTQEQSQGGGAARGPAPAGQSVRRSAGEDPRPPPGSRRKTRPPPVEEGGKCRRGCATRRRARSSGAHLEAPRRLGSGPTFPLLAPAQPPGTHSGRGTPPPAPPGRSGSPHLANSTVPCSSGLRLTARQLCRISSGSGRSMLARGRAGREAGTLGARAPSPHVPRHLRGDAGHSAPPTAPCPLPAPGGGAPPCPPGWRFRGPRSGRCALRPAAPTAPRPAPPGPGRFKATAAPAPLRPSRRSSLGNRLCQGRPGGRGNGWASEPHRNRRASLGLRFFIPKLVRISPLAG